MSEYIEKEVGIVSPVPVGAWSNATAYKVLNIVNNVGSTYIAKLANQGIEPGVASNWQTYWMLLAERGVGIQSTSIDEETGNLIITYTDGEVVDAGNVVPVEEFAELKHEMEEAISDAETATESANDAATLAETKAGLADGAATLATEKAGLADDAATLANQKAQLASEAAELADTKAALADQKATLAQEAADDAQAKAILAEDAATNANQAAEEARSIAPSKLDKQSYESTRKQAYTKDKDGQQSMTDLDTGSNAATIPVRDENGTFHVGTATQSTHPATKGYVDTQNALNEKVANKVTIIDDNSTDTQYPSAKAVNDKIKALPVPMQYKGTLGVGGTIQALPEPAEDNEGFEYKVITDGTYAGQSAHVGDVFISNGTSWDLIPSGDEPSGTVTNVNIEGDGGIDVSGSPITTSGTIKVKNTGVRSVSTGATNGTIKVDTNGTEAEVPVAGLQSGAFINAGTKVDKVSVPTEEDQVYAKDADGTQKMINVPDITAEVEAEIEGIENGSIEVSQAKSARAINPLTEESGTTQKNPFISQGTGTNNNSEVVDTTPVARQIEKQGNTIVKNQLMDASYTRNGLVISGQHIKITKENKPASISADIQTLQSSVPVGHKILTFIANKKGGDFSGTAAIGLFKTNPDQWVTYFDLTTDSYKISTTSVGISDYIHLFLYTGYDISADVEFDIYFVNLTQWFNGNSNIPQDLLDNPSHFSWYYNGSLAYDAGSLQNCDGIYLVCTGRNLFNPATVVSGQLEVDGTVTASSSYKTSDYILITPNRPYYIERSDSSRIKFYDANKQPLRTDAYDVSITGTADSTFTASANAIYVRFTIVNSRVNTAGLSLYYSPDQGGEGYNQHYPYVAPKTYDTGTENLLAFDTKDFDGTWHKNSKSVNLGNLTWEYVNYDGISVFYAELGDSKLGYLTKGICSKYIKATNAVTSNVKSNPNKTFCFNTTFAYVNVRDDSYTSASDFKTAMNGVMLQYELATPTTEQGTAFDSNINIDDYGMMYWLNSNNELVSIPQGVKIQYPPAYIETLDTLVTYTNGDVTSLAKKEDITDAALNARGYYKLQDLSNQITDLLSGILVITKKLVKLGNVVTLSFVGQNDTGSTIAANTALFKLPSGAYDTNFNVLNPCIATSQVIFCRILYNASGSLNLSGDWANGTSLFINVSFVV